VWEAGSGVVAGRSTTEATAMRPGSVQLYPFGALYVPSGRKQAAQVRNRACVG